MTATAAAGSRLAGWSGACAGAARTCVVTMAAARAVVAAFVEAPRTFALAVTTSGSGVVTSAPAGIRCKPTCTASMPRGAKVALDRGRGEEVDVRPLDRRMRGAQPGLLRDHGCTAHDDSDVRAETPTSRRHVSPRCRAAGARGRSCACGTALPTTAARAVNGRRCIEAHKKLSVMRRPAGRGRSRRRSSTSSTWKAPRSLAPGARSVSASRPRTQPETRAREAVPGYA